MRDPAGPLRIAIAGVLVVTLLASLFSLMSRFFSARPVLYYLLLAFAAVPAVLIVTGFYVARASRASGADVNESIASSAGLVLIVVIAGLGLWLLLSASLFDIQDPLAQFYRGLYTGRYDQTVFMAITYALSGAIGGIVYNYMARDQSCNPATDRT
jgi:hypothetical protein